MQKEDQNSLYQVLSNYIPKGVITTKNSGRTWVYGYNKKYDVVIISKDLMNQANKNLPKILQYSEHSIADSMLNTPPTFAWYVAGKVFKWIKKSGGLKYFQDLNRKKAEILYEFLDSSDFYLNKIEKNQRSLMNVTFNLADEQLNESFLNESRSKNLLNLKGHALVGGMRASIYNAMPLEGVKKLVQFMKEFESKHG